MKTVLAFGDSLTWGADPETGGRHGYEDRWPTALGQALGNDVLVIPEGLSGRTTCLDDHASLAELNGARSLPMLLATHMPLDLVLIMLGTNDLKPRLCGMAVGAALGMRRLAQIVRTYPFGADVKPPEVLLISPPAMVAAREEPKISSFQGSLGESFKLASLYQAVADEVGAAFFDAGTVATASPIDGVHLDTANTRAIGEKLEPLVRSLLSRAS